MRLLSTSALELTDVPNSWWNKAYTIRWDTEFFDPKTGALVGQHEFVESGTASIEGSTLHIGGETGTLIAGQITITGLWPLGNAARTRSERQLVFKR
jgi:hypothetical protein